LKYPKENLCTLDGENNEFDALRAQTCSNSEVKCKNTSAAAGLAPHFADNSVCKVNEKCAKFLLNNEDEYRCILIKYCGTTQWWEVVPSSEEYKKVQYNCPSNSGPNHLTKPSDYLTKEECNASTKPE